MLCIFYIVFKHNISIMLALQTKKLETVPFVLMFKGLKCEQRVCKVNESF